jgi:hypothetical protein
MTEATSSKACSMAPDMLWDERNWKALTFAIYSRKCILLLGPDAAMEKAEGGELRPVTDILANDLAMEVEEKFLKSPRWNIDTNDLPQVSQCYLMNHDRFELEDQVTSFYAARENLTSELHEDLAQLPFHLIITSTWDRMLANAYARSESPRPKKPRIEFFHFKGPRQDQVKMGTVESPLIYQLYGGLQNQESLVITENDLLTFLVNVTSSKAPLPDNILSELTSRDKSLLFLGFGFRHWYLRVLLHMINFDSKENRSFALERIAAQGLEDIRKTNLYIENKRWKIQICDQELNDFAKELVSRYTQRYELQVSVTPPDAPEAWLEPPTVFISYVRENENTVSMLQRKLKEFGLDVHIDRDILEAGVKWSPKIDEFISEVDYFIFLLSQDMVHQHETPAYEELKEAFKRQTRFRADVTFIIPVRIDDCGIPQDLKNLHVETVDLQGGGGVDKIVQAIKRDFQRRKAQGYAA